MLRERPVRAFTAGSLRITVCKVEPPRLTRMLPAGSAETVDKSLGKLLAEFVLAANMADCGPVETLYEGLRPNNRLRLLLKHEKELLVGIAVSYQHFRDSDGAYTTALEEAEDLSNQIEETCSRMRLFLSGTSCGQLFATLLPDALTTSRRLRRIGRQLKSHTIAIGKKGHKSKNLANSFLVMCAEFVKIKTESSNAEDLAELLQIVLEDDQKGDTSGDAIRKKRRYLMKTYPALYIAIKEAAEEL